MNIIFWWVRDWAERKINMICKRCGRNFNRGTFCPYCGCQNADVPPKLSPNPASYYSNVYHSGSFSPDNHFNTEMPDSNKEFKKKFVILAGNFKKQKFTHWDTCLYYCSSNCSYIICKFIFFKWFFWKKGSSKAVFSCDRKTECR